MTRHIEHEGGPGAVLIFLPGWDDITKLHDALEKLPESRLWKLYPLHGSMPTSQQKDIFKSPPTGLRKVVIATNIAESSITIDDVVFVIDSGKHKEKSYDAENKIACLLPSWVSKASAHQRRGRAGRVQAGYCWHLYSKMKERELEEYQQPEIVRTPLEQLCLQVRALRLAPEGLGGVENFILKAVTPPSEKALMNALETLHRIGAFKEDESLSPLGRHLATLPMDPQIGKSLIYASMLGCLDPILTITALL